MRARRSRSYSTRASPCCGRLTKANLGREAQLSHATVHRVRAILLEWDQAVAARGDCLSGPQPDDEQVAQLRKRLTNKLDECRDLRRQLEAAATVIATLHHENNALRTQLSRTAIVLPVDFTAPAAHPGTDG